MGRKPLDLTPEERTEYTKKRKREWELANTDTVFQYRRKSVLNCCFRRSSLPTRTTVLKYGFTEEELKPIYDRLVHLPHLG